MKTIGVIVMIIGGLLYSVPDFKWLEHNPKNYGDKGIVIVPSRASEPRLGTLYFFEYKKRCDEGTLSVISGDGCWELRNTLDLKDDDSHYKNEDLMR